MFNSSRIERLTDRLEALIDPFDLDVFTPHLNSNLNRLVQRTSVSQVTAMLSVTKDETQVSWVQFTNLLESSMHRSEIQKTEPLPRRELGKMLWTRTAMLGGKGW